MNEQLLAPRIHDGETESPDATPHKIHPEQSGNHEVYVARSALSDPALRHADRIGASSSHLNRAVRKQTRHRRLATHRIERIPYAALRVGRNEKRDLRRPKGACSRAVADDLDDHR
ncbi:MAG: hypothetical protein H0T48_13390 [Gemmatimonadaceae bacterium]|nr:hypothetical protein [Gemmatimonadaceae bacterium]